jgi:hypothetical protein
MNKRLAVAFVLLVWRNPVSAQLRPPNKAGMTMGHVHLNVRSIERIADSGWTRSEPSRKFSEGWKESRCRLDHPIAAAGANRTRK